MQAAAYMQAMSMNMNAAAAARGGYPGFPWGYPNPYLYPYGNPYGAGAGAGGNPMMDYAAMHGHTGKQFGAGGIDHSMQAKIAAQTAAASAAAARVGNTAKGPTAPAGSSLVPEGLGLPQQAPAAAGTGAEDEEDAGCG